MVKNAALKISPAIVASILREQVHDRRDEQHRGDRNQPERDFGLADVQVAGNFPFAISGLGEAQHQHRQRFHGEAPDHAEGVERSQNVHVAQAQDDGQQLHADDQVDDAVTRAVTMMRFLEPAGQHAVFGHAIQHAIRAHDRSVLRSGQNQNSHQHHESMEEQLQAGRADQVHGDAADQVGEVVRPHVVGDDHHREERNQRREQQAVDENHQPGFFQVLQLGMLDLAVDLGQRLFAAHGQHGVAEANEEDDPASGGANQVPLSQPSDSLFSGIAPAGLQGTGRQLHGRAQHRDRAPHDEDHHHHGGDHHDLHRLLAGFVDALRVLPPEVEHDDDRQAGGEMVVGKVQRAVQVDANVLDETRQVLSGGYGADGAGQDVVEEQGRDRELGQRLRPWPL